MGAKQKFSSMDVGAMVSVLQNKVLRNQVANVYDLAASKAFLLRLKNREKDSKVAGTEFSNIILEPGTRFHITKFDREKSTVPSSATMKLRKHLRNLRLTDVQQVGLDRVVLFTFSGAGGANFQAGGDPTDNVPEPAPTTQQPVKLFLVLELFVRGSLVLCDHDMKVLFRSVTYEYATNHVPIGEVYKFDQPAMTCLVNPKIATDQTAPTVPCPTRIREFCEAIVAKEDEEAAKAAADDGTSAAAAGAGGGKRNKKKKKGGDKKLDAVLLQLLYCVHPSLCNFALEQAGLKPTVSVRDALLDGESFGQKMAAAASGCLEMMRSVSSYDNKKPATLGCSLGGDPSAYRTEALRGFICIDDKQYLDFSPVKCLLQHYTEDMMATSTEQDGNNSTSSPSSSRAGILKTTAATTTDGAGAVSSVDNKKPPKLCRVFADFGECVDEFFSQREIQKIEEAKQQKQSKVLSKVERIKKDHEERLQKMEQIQFDADLKALLLEENLELVDNCITMLNARGRIDWQQLWQEIKIQQGLGHPLAQHIHSLEFAKNQFTILLEDSVSTLGTEQEESSSLSKTNSQAVESEEEDDDLDALFSDDDDGDINNEKEGKSKRKNANAQTQRQDLPMVTLPIDLGLTAYGNVAKLHAHRKATKSKNEKTVLAKDRVLKQAEKKAQLDVKKIERDHKVQNLRQVRQLTWFESKFHWFLSSEGFLCLQGRDATTQDMLIKRYMDPAHDVVVGTDHVSYHGATAARLVLVKMRRDLLETGSCTKKMENYQLEIPPLTLQEAAVLCLAQSEAWAKKDLVPCWWVFGKEIKFRSLEIEGKAYYYDIAASAKNLLPPSKLEMGYCLLFEVELSNTRHAGERKIRSGPDADEQQLASSASSPNIEDEDETAENEEERNVDEEGGPLKSHEDEQAEDQHSNSSQDDDKEISDTEDIVQQNYGTPGPEEHASPARSAQSRFAAVESEQKETLLPTLEEEVNAKLTSNGREINNYTGQAQSLEDSKLSGLGEKDLDESQVNDEYKFHPTERIAGPGHKKKLTKKERELAKKGIVPPAPQQQNDAADSDVDEPTDGGRARARASNTKQNQKSKNSTPPTTTGSEINQKGASTSSTAQQAVPKAVPRGQKAKLKRVAKYADQDEETRTARMALIGAKEKKVAPVLNAGIFGEQINPGDDNDAADGSPSGRTVDHGQQNTGDKKGGAKPGAKGKGKQAGGTARAETKPKTQWQLEGERTAIQEALLLDPLTWDARFTGRPCLEDAVVRAIPMCAPWSAINKSCWFKVRLTPSTGSSAMKKGRLREIAQHLFFDDRNQSDISLQLQKEQAEGDQSVALTPQSVLSQWKEYMHAIPDMEIMNALISGSQIQAAGVQKVQKQMKKEKVTKAKNNQQQGGNKAKK
ncbi:unnamed protein product [Amoebophrya sp. A120]|nr:unnamed protein product [Amoebophrya sp. A120]|eukprot:GSA120T00001603001.1